MGEFRMPTLGADMDAGSIVEWRVQPGDTVHRGDIVAVVETDKSTIEVEVFEDGTIEQLLVAPGDEVPVGTVLAKIRPIGAPAAPVTTPAAAPLPAPAPPRADTTASARPGSSGATPAVPLPVPPTRSPLVRHLAEREHIDLSAVAGSGPGGSITRHDVEAAAGGSIAAHVGRRAAARPRSSPLARRLAATYDLALTDLTGSGPTGAVIAADVERARSAQPTTPAPAPAPPPAPAPAATTRPMPAAAPRDRHAALRASLGALMARSKREIPHYYLSTTIDFEPSASWLAAQNEQRPVTERLLPVALLLRATVLAATEVPVMNGHWIDGAFRPSDAVHLGVAISLRGGGLVAPAIRDAQDLSVDELMRRLRDLVTRARAGTLRSSEMTDPTITVTNLGDQGVEAVFGVIYPPQVALVGFGKIVERPWADQHMLTVRPVVTATVSGDHRAGDGHDGARFLASLDHHLQTPEEL